MASQVDGYRKGTKSPRRYPPLALWLLVVSALAVFSLCECKAFQLQLTNLNDIPVTFLLRGGPFDVGGDESVRMSVPARTTIVLGQFKDAESMGFSTEGSVGGWGWSGTGALTAETVVTVMSAGGDTMSGPWVTTGVLPAGGTSAPTESPSLTMTELLAPLGAFLGLGVVVFGIAYAVGWARSFFETFADVS